jgi:PPM family protein phosphatase
LARPRRWLATIDRPAEVWLKRMIRVTSFSEAGGHLLNEDAFLVAPHRSASDHWLCFLADGQGGSSGGAEAARIACSTAAEAALRRSPEALAEPLSWGPVLQEADQAVDRDRDAGFTTLLGFCITSGRLVGASCGDSTICALSGSEPARNVTAAQLKNPPVGSGAAMFVSFAVPLLRPWSVLAMSDGVWKYVGWERLVQATTELRGEALVEALQKFARLPRSGRFPDDFTLVLFEDSV